MESVSQGILHWRRNSLFSGPHSRAILPSSTSSTTPRGDVVAFVVDDEYLREDSSGGLPVVPFSEAASRFPPADYEMYVAVALGRANSIRERKFDACRAAGYSLATYVSSKAAVWPDLTHGENCFICEGSSIQPLTRMGVNVTIGTGTRIAHGAVIGHHASFASNVCLGGNCEIGERAYFGLGAIVRDHCKVGSDSIVAMGATVVRDLPPESVLLAPPSTVADSETAGVRAPELVPRSADLSGCYLGITVSPANPQKSST